MWSKRSHNSDTRGIRRSFRSECSMQNRQLISRFGFPRNRRLDGPGGSGRHPGACTAVAVEGAAFLKQYCVTCHSQKLKTGGTVSRNHRPAGCFPEWRDPGEGRAQAGERRHAARLRLGGRIRRRANAFLASLETSLDRASAAHPNPGRPMMLHRLNRMEYLNSVRDLFDVELNPDDSSLLPRG